MISKKHEWNKQCFLSKLNFLRAIHHSKLIEQGFSLIEAMAAMLIVTITLSSIGPMFMQQRQKNVENDILTGAVTLSQQILDDLRRQETLEPGENTESNIDSFGRTYDYTQNICTQKPTVSTNGSVTCSTTPNPSSEARYVLLQINNNGKTVYTVETIYTKVR